MLGAGDTYDQVVAVMEVRPINSAGVEPEPGSAAHHRVGAAVAVPMQWRWPTVSTATPALRALFAAAFRFNAHSMPSEPLPEMVEIPPPRFGPPGVDDIAAGAEASDLQAAQADGTIGDLLAGRVAGRTTAAEITVSSPSGSPRRRRRQWRPSPAASCSGWTGHRLKRNLVPSNSSPESSTAVLAAGL
jgi:hypothetical protein